MPRHSHCFDACLLWSSFAHLHVHHSPLLLGFGWVNPDHEHPASAGEVGGGEEVALASADDEVVAHLDGLALVGGRRECRRWRARLRMGRDRQASWPCQRRGFR